MEREERRRKILSRGSDRMALITGRIQTLDPNPLSKSSTFSHDHIHVPPIQHARSTSESGAASTNYDGAFFQDYNQLNSGEDNVPNKTMRHAIDEDESSKDNGEGKKFSNVEEKEVASQSSQNQLTPRSSKSSDNAKFPKKEKPSVPRFHSLTCKEINSSIISSENTRVICSIVIAILVVLSYVSLPHNVVRSKSLIAYRPLYVVLLTNVLIVAGRLALYAQTREEDYDHKEVKYDRGDGHNWGEAVKLLEFGLVLHQALRGLFIDCSFYLVLVVCGPSLV